MVKQALSSCKTMSFAKPKRCCRFPVGYSLGDKSIFMQKPYMAGRRQKARVAHYTNHAVVSYESCNKVNFKQELQSRQKILENHSAQLDFREIFCNFAFK